jgi:predicted TIM-barrel fold metal-dependent hydrolase
MLYFRASHTQICWRSLIFPVDKVRSSYKTLWKSYQTLIHDFLQDEHRAMLHDNALQYYRL